MTAPGERVAQTRDPERHVESEPAADVGVDERQRLAQFPDPVRVELGVGVVGEGVGDRPHELPCRPVEGAAGLEVDGDGLHEKAERVVLDLVTRRVPDANRLRSCPTRRLHLPLSGNGLAADICHRPGRRQTPLRHVVHQREVTLRRVALTEQGGDRDGE